MHRWHCLGSTLPGTSSDCWVILPVELTCHCPLEVREGLVLLCELPGHPQGGRVRTHEPAGGLRSQAQASPISSSVTLPIWPKPSLCRIVVEAFSSGRVLANSSMEGLAFRASPTRVLYGWVFRQWQAEASLELTYAGNSCGADSGARVEGARWGAPGMSANGRLYRLCSVATDVVTCRQSRARMRTQRELHRWCCDFPLPRS